MRRKEREALEGEDFQMKHSVADVEPVHLFGAPLNNGNNDLLNGHDNGSTPIGYPDIVTPEITGGQLSSIHRKQLIEESSISEEAIAKRGYFTQTNKQALILLGFKPYQALLPALVIPTYNWRGERVGYVSRPDVPRNRKNGKPAKYELPEGASPVLDFSPLTSDQIDDPAKPLFITEGAKTADSLASRGFCVCNLNGVYGYRGKNAKGGITALPDWQNIPLNGRTVYIAYDSDVATKPQVENAMRHLVVFLQSKGALVKVIYLHDGPNGEKTGLDDFFARGGTVTELLSLARDLEPIEESKRKRKEKAKAEKLAKFEAAGKPVIETHDRPLTDLLSDLSAALVRHNGDAPTLFDGTGGLREVIQNQDGITVTELVKCERLQVIADKEATWITTPADSQLPREIAPPAALCQQFIVSREYWRNIPPFKRILTAPFVDREGNICIKRGYNAVEQVWLSLPEDFQLPDTTPTPKNVESAKSLLLDKLMGEVAFKDQASRANALGLMLLPFVRLYIDALQDGQTPIHLVDAPTQSSGKTYVVMICLSPFCEVVPTSDKKDEKESQKEIFALLAEGTFYIFIDNVKSSLGSPEVATAVTSGKMRGRVLGASKTETVSSNIVWAASSNNAQLDGDIVSRSVLIRLDTDSETPEYRKFDFNPVQYIAQNRAEVQAAILTLIRAWLASGKPSRTKKVSRFPAWERVIGGILETVGVEGFLENHREARENSDPETAAWHSFVDDWYAKHGEHFKTVKELMETPGGDDLKALIGDKAPTKVLGKMLQTRRDKVINGFKILKHPERKRVGNWRLVPILVRNESVEEIL